MIKEIPIPEGKKIIGYHVLETLDKINCYVPIYESIYTDGAVYTDGLKMYLCNEGRFISTSGNEEHPKNLKCVTTGEEVDSFYEQLTNNGYFISPDNKLVRGYWFPEYNHHCGFYPCFASGRTKSYGLNAAKEFNEAYQYRSMCLSRCNEINKLLNRGYAKQV